MRRRGLCTFHGVVAVVAVTLLASCSGASRPDASRSTTPPASSPSSSSSSSSSPAASPSVSPRAGATEFTCANSIDQLPAPTAPQRAVLEAVALDTSSSLQAEDAGGNAPYRLFAKTALMVHVGSPAEIDVPTAWAKRAAVTWGNRAEQWTGQLVIPGCPADGPGGDWLVYPGGISVDRPSCVPLDVHAGDAVVTVRLSVGAPC